jgi:hypothetical protein
MPFSKVNVLELQQLVLDEQPDACTNVVDQQGLWSLRVTHPSAKPFCIQFGRPLVLIGDPDCRVSASIEPKRELTRLINAWIESACWYPPTGPHAWKP